jgi:hypothetical protein
MPVKKLLAELWIDMLSLRHFTVMSKNYARNTTNREISEIKQLSSKLNTDFLLHCRNRAEIHLIWFDEPL